LPQTAQSNDVAPKSSTHRGSANRSADTNVEGEIRKIMEEIMGRDTSTKSTQRARPIYVSSGLSRNPRGLLEEAGIGRFSMCFNEGASGVLRLDTPPVKEAHGSVGAQHWGLDFRGISIGNAEFPLHFCSTQSMRPGQKTPCGAIPDSGTTMITGPQEQLDLLFTAICDNWPRCSKNYTALVKAAKDAKEAIEHEYGVDPWDIKLDSSSKKDVLYLLLADCEQWLEEGAGLGELPDLHFHVQGTNGTKQALKLAGDAYIMESLLKHAEHTDALLKGRHKFPHKTGGMDESGRSTQRANKVCTPAFSPMKYNTKANGPVWIFGTPFFYEYIVGYDMFATPPSMSFSSVQETPCGSCGKGSAGLLASAAMRAARRPRWLPAPARQPTGIDVSQPL